MDRCRGKRRITWCVSAALPVVLLQCGWSEASSTRTSEDIFQSVAPTVVTIAGRGSGFIVDSSGTVITNLHVVAGAMDGASMPALLTKDGRSLPVMGVMAYDRLNDLCALKVEDEALPHAEFAGNDGVDGERVFVIGAPQGLSYTITDGLLSGTRVINGRRLLQFSAPISGGNSGGPLVNSGGQIIGIVALAKVDGKDLNFAVPISAVKTA